MPIEPCVNCRRRRRGRRYVFHVGRVLSVGGSVSIGIAETITHYQIHGPYSGFVCGRCAFIHFSLRYGLPLVGCVAIELVLLLGSPFPRIHMLPVGLQISAGIAMAASAGVMIGGWAAGILLVNRRGPGGALLAALKVLVASITLIGPLFLLLAVFAVGPDDHRLLDDPSASDDRMAWFVTILAGAQLLTLWFMWADKAASMETLAWRRSEDRLKTRLGKWSLTGFNSVEFERLQKTRR